MRTIITLAVGFWIAMEVNTQYEKRMCIQKQFRQKQRLEAFLKQKDFSKKEIRKITKTILNI